MSSPRQHRATMRSACASTRSWISSSAVGPSCWRKILRWLSCNCPSLNSVVPRPKRLERPLAATPQPLMKVSGSRSAARTSSKRPIAYMRWRGSHTDGAGMPDPGERVAGVGEDIVCVEVDVEARS